MTTTATTNRTYYAVKTVAYIMFALGLLLSIAHIFDLFRHTLAASVLTAAAVPAFIDGFQLVGRLIRGQSFAAGTRKVGLGLQMFGATVSLIANVVAGHTLGDKIGGAIFVIGYITIEAIAERIRPAADDSAALVAAQEQAAAAAEAARQAEEAAAAALAAAQRQAEEEAAVLAAATEAAARRARLSQRAKNAAATRRRNKELAAKIETVELIDEPIPAVNTAAYL